MNTDIARCRCDGFSLRGAGSSASRLLRRPDIDAGIVELRFKTHSKQEQEVILKPGKLQASNALTRRRSRWRRPRPSSRPSVLRYRRHKNRWSQRKP